MALLEGKTALVTGASSGIGEATAVALAAEGACVAIMGRRADRLRLVEARLKGLGAPVATIVGDVTNEEECLGAVGTAIGRFDKLDILVNGAGVMLLSPVLEADTTEWGRMIHTNVLGLMYMTHAALPDMVTRQTGDIVNVSSVAGRLVRPGYGVYNASKWAVNAFSEALRQEVTKQGVRVSLVEPGYVHTELRDHISHAASRQKSLDNAQGIRVLNSSDIADTVVFVVSRPSHVAVNEVLVRPTDQI